MSPTCSRELGSALFLKSEKTAADRFLLAADKAPRRFRANFQQKFIELQGSMLAHTPTPMGELLAAQPTNLQLMGAGRRAATLRSRVRAVKRFLDWLAVSHGKGYPTELHDYTGHLQARQSEPCTRGASKGAHKAIVFIEEVAGVTAQSRITTTAVFGCTERAPRQLNPRSPSEASTEDVHISMLAALEELTINDKALPHHRVCAWWILLQSWVTMRFSDHRGLKPSDIHVVGQHDVRQVDEVRNDRRRQDTTKTWPFAWFTSRHAASR